MEGVKEGRSEGRKEGRKERRNCLRVVDAYRGYS